MGEDEQRRLYVQGLGIRAAVAGSFLLFFFCARLAGLDLQISGFGGVAAGLGFLVLVNAPLWLLGKWRGFPIHDFFGHWLMDILVVTGIVYYLGVLDVPLAAAAFMVMIVSSATFATMRVALLLATFAAAAYAGVVAAEVLEVLPHHHVAAACHVGNTARVVFAGGAVTFFYVFAYLGGTLATQLRVRATEIEQQRNKLADSYEKERLSREGMELLSGVVQHDVYSPLGVVSGACEEALVSCERGDTVEASRFVRMIKERLRSIESAVESLTTLGANEGHRYGDSIATDLLKRVLGLAEDLRTEAIERRVEILIEGEWPMLRNGGAQVYHVVRNLIGNAIKCVADDGSGRIWVHAERAAHGDWLIRVEDNGPGVPGVDLLTTDEGSVSRMPRLGGGSGAGLLLSRNLALRWGGDLTHSNRVGGGARFGITLPAEMLVS